MTETELKRKEFDRFLIKKDFKLSDGEVVAKAIEIEKMFKESKKSTAE